MWLCNYVLLVEYIAGKKFWADEDRQIVCDKSAPVLQTDGTGVVGNNWQIIIILLTVYYNTQTFSVL